MIKNGPYDFPNPPAPTVPPTPPAPIDPGIVIPSAPEIRINSQPQDATVKNGTAARYRLTRPPPTARRLPTSGTAIRQTVLTGGTAIDGATVATYRALTAAKGEAYYYCVVNASGADAVPSSVAKLTVRNTPRGNFITIEGDVVDDMDAKIKGATVALSPKVGNSENPQAQS